MFYNHHNDSGHFWLNLLSFTGAFLLGKECERMMRKHRLFHGQFKEWEPHSSPHKNNQTHDSDRDQDFSDHPASTSYSS